MRLRQGARWFLALTIAAAAFSTAASQNKKPSISVKANPPVGFTPLKTIECATKTGTEILGRGHELGTLEKGKLADVLVVDGDPVADIRVLEDRSRFIAVMQGGIVKAGQLLQPAETST